MSESVSQFIKFSLGLNIRHKFDGDRSEAPRYSDEK